MEETEKIIFNGKELKDLRNEKVYVELDSSVERDLFCTDAPKLPEYSFHIDELSISLKMTPEAENWFKNMKAKALSETWRKLKDIKHLN